MRIWLDPRKLKARSLTTQDVVQAIKEQNVQVAAGQIGAPPAPPGTAFQFTINAFGRLNTEEQFADIIVRAGDEGRIVRVRDVVADRMNGDDPEKGGVERGAKDYTFSSTFNRQPCATVAVYQLPGANALDVANQIRERLQRLSERGDWPPGLKYDIPFDTTRFVEASIQEVYATIFIAIALVVLVIFIFSAGLAGHDCPGSRDTRLAGRYVRHHGGVGVLVEHVVSVRHRVGHRHRG